jgi:hypothetical protein
MWYLLKVDALIGALVFSAAGLFIVAMFVWHEARVSATALHRLYNRLAAPLTEPHFFANSFVISRSFSRAGGRSHAGSHKIQ